MQFFDGLRDMIKYADDRELVKYLGAFGAAFLLLFGLLFYFHYSRVNWYKNQLKVLGTWRKQTQKILSDFQLVKAQQEQVEDILAKDKDFRIGEAFQSIISNANLRNKIVDMSPIPTPGETISGKTELQMTSTLRGLSMKEVTDFLTMIAQVPQLYTKDITIKRTPGRPTVDIDITVATLESAT